MAHRENKERKETGVCQETRGYQALKEMWVSPGYLAQQALQVPQDCQGRWDRKDQKEHRVQLELEGTLALLDPQVLRGHQQRLCSPSR